MNTVDRDPVTLAREVLARDGQDIAAVLAAKPGIESQTLARAVISLTAELDSYREENTRYREERARVEALADRLDDGHLRHLIRAALKGEPRG